jgi:hypothetical protein
VSDSEVASIERAAHEAAANVLVPFVDAKVIDHAVRDVLRAAAPLIAQRNYEAGFETGWRHAMAKIEKRTKTERAAYKVRDTDLSIEHINGIEMAVDMLDVTDKEMAGMLAELRIEQP